MNLRVHKALLCCSFILLFSGCTTFQIVDLKPEVSLRNEHATNVVNGVAGVDTIEVTAGEYSDAGQWQQGLVEAINKEGVLKAVVYPNDNADILIRGEVKGDFRHHGAKNFFTWWPGPLIFAHNWRGTRYIYDAQADITVTDLSTGEVLGTYHADSSHELIHVSANPFPLLGALAIIPGVVKGAMSVSPRTKYRQQMYEVVYPDLWKKIAVAIADGQAERYAQRIALLQESCGMQLNEAPKVGDIWSEFTACQIRKYRLLGQDSINENLVSVYVSDDRLYRVHVDSDGLIVRWYVLRKNKSSSIRADERSASIENDASSYVGTSLWFYN